MDVAADIVVAASPDRVFAWVERLDTYPEWLDIVPRVRPDGPAPAAGDAASAPAWLVDLRGRLGPFARVKRLRMTRTAHEPPGRVVFERDERDGRSHAPWVLTATVAPDGDGARLRVDLHYGGALWGPVLERMLADTIERSRPRLAACVSTGPPSPP